VSTQVNTAVEKDLRKKETEILSELRTIRRIEEDNHDRRKSLFIEWADILEQQIEAGIITIPKTHITDRMAKVIKTHGGSDGEITYMYECMPHEYKTSQEVKALSSTELHTMAAEDKYVSEASKAQRNEIFDALKKIKTFDRSHLSRRDQQELAMLLGEVHQIQVKACEERHIPLTDTTSADHTWQDDLVNPFSEKFSINKPRPYYGYYAEACGFAKEFWGAMEKKAEEYSGEAKDSNGNIIMPQITEEEDKEYAKAVYAFLALVSPYVDDKWRRDWFQWHKILKDRVEYSLHGAMSMSKLETAVKDCFRGVTREQIDAKMLIGFKFFGQLAEDLPKLYKISEFYKKRQQPWLSDLTVRMHEKMSFLS
jgi:hypothetical protein